MAITYAQAHEHYREQVKDARQGLVSKRKFDGAVFYCMTRYRYKHVAEFHAEDLRDYGFLVRIVQETGLGPAYRYGVYAREK